MLARSTVQVLFVDLADLFIFARRGTTIVVVNVGTMFVLFGTEQIFHSARLHVYPLSSKSGRYAVFAAEILSPPLWTWVQSADIYL